MMTHPQPFKFYLNYEEGCAVERSSMNDFLVKSHEVVLSPLNSVHGPLTFVPLKFKNMLNTRFIRSLCAVTKFS